MRVQVDATPEEWANEAEMLEMHLLELLASSPCLAKGGAPAAKKPHPSRAIRDMTDLLQREYAKMLQRVNSDVTDYLRSQVGKAAS